MYLRVVAPVTYFSRMPKELSIGYGEAGITTTKAPIG